MPYRLEFQPEAANVLRHLDAMIAQRILRKLGWLCVNYDSLTPQRLSGPVGDLYKLRVGSYRVLYTVEYPERTIVVHVVAHRRQVYRRR